MIDKEALSSIEDLHRLKTEGIITEEEFERSKERILFGSKPKRSLGLPTTGGLPNEVFAWMTLPLKRYADFNGRSGRKEFWLFQLLPAAIMLAAFVISSSTTNLWGDLSGIGIAAIVLAILALLALAVPQLALQARRFHDQDKSGWLVLINLVPYVGAIVVFVMMALPGTSGDNRYGPNPEA